MKTATNTVVPDAIVKVRMIDAVRGLAPLVSQYRDELADGPDLPAPLAEALIDAGLTQLWLPRVLGGPEVDPIECFEVIEALASLDGAVCWCALVSSSISRFCGLLAVEPMRRIVPTGANFAGSGGGKPNGSVTRDGDGWRINGHWTLASFSRHSTVTALLCVEHEDGKPRTTPRGGPAIRIALVPSDRVNVVGNWNSGGLRSSGSHDVTCTDVWVPDDWTDDMSLKNRQPGPLYALPLMTAASIPGAAVPLGIAAAAIDAFTTLAGTKTPFGTGSRLCEQENVQLDVAWATMRLRAARAFVVEAATALWSSACAGQAVTEAQEAAMCLATWNAGEAGKEIVERMYKAAGSTAVLEETLFSAQLRDVQVACQHVVFATRTLVPSGRFLLGMEPGTRQI
jgi:alkylation response protein AidB-like acyl-CoA dehydrogenase